MTAAVWALAVLAFILAGNLYNMTAELRRANSLLMRIAAALQQSNAISRDSIAITAEATGIVKRTEEAAVARILANTPPAGGHH